MQFPIQLLRSRINYFKKVTSNSQLVGWEPRTLWRQIMMLYHMNDFFIRLRFCSGSGSTSRWRTRRRTSESSSTWSTSARLEPSSPAASLRSSSQRADLAGSGCRRSTSSTTSRRSITRTSSSASPSCETSGNNSFVAKWRLVEKRLNKFTPTTSRQFCSKNRGIVLVSQSLNEGLMDERSNAFKA